MKKIFVLVLIFGQLIAINNIFGQNLAYYPKGDPEKWNFEINPCLWLPAINGEVKSQKLTEEFDIPAVELLSNLKMAFMFNAEVSKGKFFAASSYMYTRLESEEVLWTSDNGEKSVVAIPDLKLNIAGLIGGMRFRVSDKWIIDPYVGVRYTNYHIYGSVEGIKDTTKFDTQVDFWDPVVGLQVAYYPTPRVPVILKTDVGGFGAGTELSWTASINSGYAISPLVDLVAGFLAYGSNYEKEVPMGKTIGLNMIMYGFDLGAKFYFPKRYRDKTVFKKDK